MALCREFMAEKKGTELKENWLLGIGELCAFAIYLLIIIGEGGFFLAEIKGTTLQLSCNEQVPRRDTTALPHLALGLGDWKPKTASE